MSQYRSIIGVENSRLAVDGESEFGSMTGLASVKGWLDDYGTIWIDKSYVELDHLVRHGLLPDTHAIETNGIPTMESNLGMIMVAEETNEGLFIKADFLDKQRSQEARKEIKARIDAGKFMGLSIGFDLLDSLDIMPRDYDKELPKYLKPEYLQIGLQRARLYKKVTIMLKTRVNEVSVTYIPANELSGITGVRFMNETVATTGAEAPEVIPPVIEKPAGGIRTQFLGDYVNGSILSSTIWTLTNALIYNVMYDCLNDEEVNPGDNRTKLANALQEYSDYVIGIYDTLQKLDAQADAADPSMGGADDIDNELPSLTYAKGLRVFFENPKDFSTPVVRKNKVMLQFALDVNTEVLARMKELTQLRKETVRSGKVVSTENHKTLTDIHSRMAECMREMEDFLKENDPNTGDVPTRSREEFNSLRVFFAKEQILN